MSNSLQEIASIYLVGGCVLYYTVDWPGKVPVSPGRGSRVVVQKTGAGLALTMSGPLAGLGFVIKSIGER